MKKTTLLSDFTPLILLFLITLSSAFGQAPKQCVTPLQSGDKVLFIGNSFTEWSGPLPNMIKSLITASGSGLNVSFTLKVKGMGIYKEYATWNSLGMIAEIQKGGWKYVVLQGWEDAIRRKDQGVTEGGLPVADYIGYPQCQDTMLKYLQVLDAEIKKVGAITILYEPHVGKTSFFGDMTKSHSTYAKLQYNVSSFYAPIVNAWDSIRLRYPATDSGCTTATPGSFADFLYSDCGHQSTTGMMLDALTFYTIFTRRSGETLKPIHSMTKPEFYEEFARLGYNTGKSILAANGCGFTDTQAPTVPAGLNATNKMADGFVLNWTASTDNIGVLGYRIYKDDVLIGTTAFLKFNVGGLSPATTYAMKIKAFDSEGNNSALSAILNVTTTSNVSVDTAGVLMDWDFTFQGNKASVPTTAVMNGISITDPSAVVSTGPVFTANNFNANAISMSKQSKGTLAEAITANHYITFSIAPQAGNSIGVDSVKINVFSQNRPRNWTLMSSVGGFTAGNEIGTRTTNGWINVTGISNISSIIEFRIYVWGPSDGGAPWESFGLTDLVISGKVKSDALPLFPTGLTATNLTETGFNLNWKAAKNAVSYEVFKNGASVGTTASLTMAISSVTINSTYIMTVKATDNVGTVSEESVPLNVKIPDLHIPSVPANLTVTGITMNSFILHWNACTDNVGVTLYEINMNGNTYGNTADNYLPVPFLTANTSYSMTVRSKDAAGNVSSFSTALVVKTLTAADTQAPTAPSGLASTNVLATSFTLTWTISTDNTGVTSYEVFKDGVSVGTSATNTFNVTGLTSNTPYVMTVKAKDAAGNVSAVSASKLVTTAASELSNPDVNMALFPNPAGKTINITGLSKGLITIEIHNILGSKVYAATLSGDSEIDISSLSAGIYFITLFDGMHTRNLKFVKE